MGFGNFGDGGGISWTICKQSAPRCRADRHQHLIISQFFTGRMLFLTPNQQRQSTEGITVSPPQLTRAISRVKLFNVSVYRPISAFRTQEINDILKLIGTNNTQQEINIQQMTRHV